VSRDVRLFYCYRVISRLYFHLPVLFLHLYTVQMGLYCSINAESMCLTGFC
jgi:hypothetical protein